jgi:hypothetical protein
MWTSALNDNDATIEVVTLVIGDALTSDLRPARSSRFRSFTSRAT